MSVMEQKRPLIHCDDSLQHHFKVNISEFKTAGWQNEQLKDVRFWKIIL